jgi:hypothetical protein
MGKAQLGRGVPNNCLIGMQVRGWKYYLLPEVGAIGERTTRETLLSGATVPLPAAPEANRSDKHGYLIVGRYFSTRLSSKSGLN